MFPTLNQSSPVVAASVERCTQCPRSASKHLHSPVRCVGQSRIHATDPERAASSESSDPVFPATLPICRCSRSLLWPLQGKYHDSYANSIGDVRLTTLRPGED